MLGAYLFGLLNVSKQIWSQRLAEWEPSCFLSVTWHGSYVWAGVQGVEVFILLGTLFLPSVF
jgi:hypothetical protein